MNKLYSGILATAIGICCGTPNSLFAQKGPSEGSADKVRTKIVRDCEYEVLPGLAEVTSVEVIRPAAESSLQYDEHEVLFKFTPMEGGDLLEMLRDEDIEFVLRSRAVRIPVGPEYIKKKGVKVGTRYAMNLLQTKNRDACLERFTYESKALDNDLFEAYENIIDYTKEAYVRQLEEKERAHERRKAEGEDKEVVETVDPTIETVVEEADAPVEEFDYGGLTEDQIANLSEAEMRALVEKNLRKKIEGGQTPSYGGSEIGIDEKKLRAEIEAKKREEYAKQLSEAQGDSGNKGGSSSSASNKSTASSKNAAAEAIKEAKRKAKEAEKQKRAEQKRKEQEAVERKRKEDEIRAKLEKEVEAEIQREIREKQEAAQLAAEQEAKEEEEKRNKKAAALEKIKSIERELAQRIVDETKRKDCVYGERISGTIEVIKVSKVKEANVSHLKYTEYEVLVTFRPDNFAELSKKDKKLWEAQYVFTLDPKGKNANPGAGYIRKYKVFKASKYQGFAQNLESGICTSIMLYSPDLPNDAGKIKLK